MKLNDIGKMATIITINVCATLLAAVRVLEPSFAYGILIASLGYITGNGVLARRRQAPSTVLAPKMPDARKVRMGDEAPDVAALLAEFEDRLLDQLGAVAARGRTDGQ